MLLEIPAQIGNDSNALPFEGASVIYVKCIRAFGQILVYRRPQYSEHKLVTTVGHLAGEAKERVSREKEQPSEPEWWSQILLCQG